MKTFLFHRRENRFADHYGTNERRPIVCMKDGRLFHLSIFEWGFLEKVTVFLRGVTSYCTKCTEASRKEVFMMPVKKTVVASHILSAVKGFMYILY